MAFALSCAMALGTLPAEALAEAVDVDREGTEQIEVVDAEVATSPDDGDDAAPEGEQLDESLSVEDDAVAIDDAAGEAFAEDALSSEESP